MKAIKWIIPPPFLTSFLAFFYSARSDFQGCQVYFSTSVMLALTLSRHQSSCAEIPASLFDSLEALSAPRLLHIPVIHSSCWGSFPHILKHPRSWSQALIFPALPKISWGSSADWQGRVSTATAHPIALSPRHQAPSYRQGHELTGQDPTKQKPWPGKKNNHSGLSFK